MMTLAMSESRTASAPAARMRILVGDDQADVLEALRLLLKGAGYQSVLVDSPQALLRAAKIEPFDLILMDLNYARDTTSGQEGLDLLSSLQAQENSAPVVVMTAWGNVDLAVEAMRRGACDFIQKPWDNNRLLATIQKQAGEASKRTRVERRVKTELDIARNVQQKLFPQRTKTLRAIEYAGQCVPAGEVSGDYYDFLDSGNGGLAFVLADVSGKGIAAALLMANLQACFRSQTPEALRSPAAVLCAVNRQFCASTPPEHYATLFYAHYDDATRSLCYVNCGHLAPILLRNGGAVERLEPTATVLGVFEHWRSEEQRVELRAGDTLVFFSDGVTEAGIDDGEEFGEERLIALMRERGGGVEALVMEIVAAAEEYGGPIAHDDITVVAVRSI
jgi:phosphoserine phosphatase RsbU/P